MRERIPFSSYRLPGDGYLQHIMTDFLLHRALWSNTLFMDIPTYYTCTIVWHI